MTVFTEYQLPLFDENTSASIVNNLEGAPSVRSSRTSRKRTKAATADRCIKDREMVPLQINLFDWARCTYHTNTRTFR